MAGRKEYGVDFMLNAALNGNFKGAFSSAQTEFAKLGNEIRDLNRTQSDVSAYQKQKAAVDATNSKLQNLQKQYDLLKQEISKTNGPTAALEREQAKLEQRIRELKVLQRDTREIALVLERYYDRRYHKNDRYTF